MYPRLAIFFTFPEDACWNPGGDAVEFGVSVGKYHGIVRVPRLAFARFLDGAVTPARCPEAYRLQRTRFDVVAECKLRQRQLAYDGNVEITGRELRGDTLSLSVRRDAPHG